MIKINKGNTYIIEVSLKDEAGNPISLASILNLSYILCPSKADPTPLLSKTLTSTGVSLQSVLQGKIEIKLYSTETDDLDEGIYYHEAAIVDSEGNVTTILSDDVHICNKIILTL